MMENDFGKQLTLLRKENKATQESLAEFVGVTPQAVSKWENGSYPDCSLLPKIADFFGVSIDCLFGRGEREKSIHEKLIDDIRTGELADAPMKMLNYGWAGIRGCWIDSTWYPVNGKKKGETYSCATFDEGFAVMRLNDNLQYFCVMPEPEDGYNAFLKADEKTAELFAFLGDKRNLEAMFLLHCNGNRNFFTEQQLTSKLGITNEEAVNILGSMMKLRLVSECSLCAEDGIKPIYSLNQSMFFVMLMAAAHGMLKQPESWELQIGRRQKPLFRYEKLDFVDNAGEKHEKHEKETEK